LLLKASVPVAVPEDCGANVTVNGTECPAGIVRGTEIPLTLNSAFVVVIDQRLTGFPVALNVPLSDLFDPVATLPKLRVVGASVNLPRGASAPESATFSCGFEAVERTSRSPEFVPTTRGTNTTLNVTLCPPARLNGTVSPFTRNAAFDTCACEMVTLAFPRFVRVSCNVFDAPGGTVPKIRWVAEAAMGPPALAMAETCCAPVWMDRRATKTSKLSVH